jgi:enterochelin esterase-like enzyme
MADQGIKNIIVKKEFLGKITSDNGRVARFRLVSEDKNRKSAWSQIFSVNAELVKVLTGDLNIVGNTIIVNWSKLSNTTTQEMYDIFVSFDGGSYLNVGTSIGTSYSFLKNGTISVKVLVQLASINPKINPTLKVYESPVRSLV